jgi:hypothetical protein
MDSTPLSSQYLHEHATKLIVDLTWKRGVTNVGNLLWAEDAYLLTY